MKQVVRAGLPRDICTGVAHLQRKIRTVPIVALSEVKIEIMHFLNEGWLHVRMFHQESVEETSTTLLRSDNEKIGQRPNWGSSRPPETPGGKSLLDASLHNLRFLSQLHKDYKTPSPNGRSTRITSSQRPTLSEFGSVALLVGGDTPKSTSSCRRPKRVTAGKETCASYAGVSK